MRGASGKKGRRRRETIINKFFRKHTKGSYLSKHGLQGTSLRWPQNLKQSVIVEINRIFSNQWFKKSLFKTLKNVRSIPSNICISNPVILSFSDLISFAFYSNTKDSDFLGN